MGPTSDGTQPVSCPSITSGRLRLKQALPQGHYTQWCSSAAGTSGIIATMWSFAPSRQAFIACSHHAVKRRSSGAGVYPFHCAASWTFGAIFLLCKLSFSLLFMYTRQLTTALL